MKRYFEGVSIENNVCKIFQDFYNKKNNCLTFLSKRANKQASIDFLGRSYNKFTKKTIKELSLEVRSLKKSYNELNMLNKGYIYFPIQKLNELMMFSRLGKENYIIYKLANKIYFINWEYYLKHNFLIEKKIISREKGYNKETWILKLPLKNFIYIGEYI